MAFINYVSKANSYCLLSSYNHLLKKTGLKIELDYHNSPQIYAECIEKVNNQQTKVHVLLSWKDKKNQECNVEVWSNEPFNKPETACKKIHKELSKLIPPINNYLNNSKEEKINA